ncbi:MAG: hypothetical protein RLP15_08480 [Cryomorphaceae bacterium]
MSQVIDISTYEHYALDYIEGSLSPSLMEAFDAFLLTHPEIAAEVDSLRDAEVLMPQDLAFDKASLKINVTATSEIDEGNYESFFIQDVEGMIDPSIQQELVRFLALNPSLSRDYQLYQQTKLLPNQNVVYPGKSNLRRAIPLWETTMTYAYRVAAILVLALGAVTAMNWLADEVYLPRTGSSAFTVMDELKDPVKSSIAKTEAPTPIGKHSASSPSLAQDASPSAGSSKVRAELPEQIPTLLAQIKHPIRSKIEDRDVGSYIPQVAAWATEEVYAQNESSQGQSMNLSQFIGKRILGIDPQKTPTTKDLLREGLFKTIDDRESVSLSTSDPDDNKRSFEFLAGNFEFRRVNYK